MEKAEKSALAQKRYRRLWRTLRLPLKLYLRLFKGFRCKTAPAIQGPVLIMSNHTSGYDELFVAAAFPQPVRFVGGEHLWRMGKPLRFLLNRYEPVISRIKGSTDAGSAAGMLRALKSGGAVCIYPEGNMTFNGITDAFHPTTARIVKAARGCTLVTFRVTGGYMVTPRWAAFPRRGRQQGVVQGIYTPEQLKAMSVQQVQELLERDLFVNAYDEVKQSGLRYRGKRLAESLETALYLCPMCGKVGLLKSHDDRFTCKCGLELQVDELGGFHADTAVPFSGVFQWDQWQEARVKAMAQEEDVMFSDPDQTLWEHLPDHTSTKVCDGTMTLNRKGLRLGEMFFPLGEISGIDLVLKDRMFFTASGRHFFVTSKHLRSGRKYVTLFKYMKAAVTA